MNENSTISNAYDGKHDEYGHDLPRWMNFEHVIDIGEADPTQTATDYYGFELPNGVAMVIQSQPSHRDHPFIVYLMTSKSSSRRSKTRCNQKTRIKGMVSNG